MKCYVTSAVARDRSKSTEKRVCRDAAEMEAESDTPRSECVRAVTWREKTKTVERDCDAHSHCRRVKKRQSRDRKSNLETRARSPEVEPAEEDAVDNSDKMVTSERHGAFSTGSRGSIPKLSCDNTWNCLFTWWLTKKCNVSLVGGNKRRDLATTWRTCTTLSPCQALCHPVHRVCKGFPLNQDSWQVRGDRTFLRQLSRSVHFMWEEQVAAPVATKYQGRKTGTPASGESHTAESTVQLGSA